MTVKSDLETQVSNLQSLLNEEIGKAAGWEGEKQMLLAQISMLQSSAESAKLAAAQKPPEVKSLPPSTISLPVEIGMQ